MDKGWVSNGAVEGRDARKTKRRRKREGAKREGNEHG